MTRVLKTTVNSADAQAQSDEFCQIALDVADFLCPEQSDAAVRLATKAIESLDDAYKGYLRDRPGGVHTKVILSKTDYLKILLCGTYLDLSGDGDVRPQSIRELVHIFIAFLAAYSMRRTALIAIVGLTRLLYRCHTKHVAGMYRFLTSHHVDASQISRAKTPFIDALVKKFFKPYVRIETATCNEQRFHPMSNAIRFASDVANGLALFAPRSTTHLNRQAIRNEVDRWSWQSQDVSTGALTPADHLAAFHGLFHSSCFVLLCEVFIGQHCPFELPDFELVPQPDPLSRESSTSASGRIAAIKKRLAARPDYRSRTRPTLLEVRVDGEVRARIERSSSNVLLPLTEDDLLITVVAVDKEERVTIATHLLTEADFQNENSDVFVEPADDSSPFGISIGFGICFGIDGAGQLNMVVSQVAEAGSNNDLQNDPSAKVSDTLQEAFHQGHSFDQSRWSKLEFLASAYLRILATADSTEEATQILRLTRDIPLSLLEKSLIQLTPQERYAIYRQISGARALLWVKAMWPKGFWFDQVDWRGGRGSSRNNAGLCLYEMTERLENKVRRSIETLYTFSEQERCRPFRVVVMRNSTLPAMYVGQSSKWISYRSGGFCNLFNHRDLWELDRSDREDVIIVGEHADFAGVSTIYGRGKRQSEKLREQEATFPLIVSLYDCLQEHKAQDQAVLMHFGDTSHIRDRAQLDAWDFYANDIASADLVFDVFYDNMENTQGAEGNLANGAQVHFEEHYNGDRKEDLRRYYKGYGVVVWGTYPESDRVWVCKGRDHLVADPSSIDAFVVALEDINNEWITTIVTVASGLSDTPQATATLPVWYSLTGYGVFVNAMGDGQLVTEVAPEGIRSCIVKAKAHEVSDPSSATAFAIRIQPRNGAEMPQPTIFSQRSDVANHPSVSVTSDPGIMRVGCGAFADWRVWGAYLTSVVPTGDDGCAASSKDHVGFPKMPSLVTCEIAFKFVTKKCDFLVGPDRVTFQWGAESGNISILTAQGCAYDVISGDVFVNASSKGRPTMATETAVLMLKGVDSTIDGKLMWEAISSYSAAVGRFPADISLTL